MNARRISIAIAFFVFAQGLFCQEQLGLRLENYAGVSSLALNPAGNLSNPLRWDVNLAGAGIFLENNYAFIRQTNTLELLRRRDDAEFVLAEDVEGQVGPNTFIVDFFNDNRQRRANFTGFVAGPSIVVKIGDRHSIGIFTNIRSATGAQKIDNAYSYYKYDNRPFFDEFEVGPLAGAAMSWTELGLNYAVKIPAGTGSAGFGASLKFLQGYEAGYIENFGTYRHTKLPGNTITIERPDGRFGYVSGNLEGETFRLQRYGRGVAVDLGFVQTFDEYDEGYRLKIGASLLDIGYLNFNKNAHAHRVNSDATATLSLNDYENFDEPDELDDLIRLFSQDALGDSLASETANSFRMVTPTALSLQADYALHPRFYLNGMLVQRLSFFGIGPPRGNLLAVTPRFEHRWFSASLPVSVFDWRDLHVGLAARLGFLVVGTDHLLSWVGRENYTGTDFYIALKINPFNLGLDLGGGGNGKRRYGGKGKVKCYNF